MKPTKKLLPHPKPDHRFVKELQKLGYKKIVGIDEVGRGALAGPIIVAAVEIYEPIFGINDSKLLSPRARNYYSDIISKLSTQIRLGSSSNEEIDQLGLSAALKLAYKRCLETAIFDLVLTDNYHLPNTPHISSIKGDRFFYPVAAASIVAKVYRDRLMRKLDKKIKGYNFSSHKGYGTKEHQAKLKKLGPSKAHRMFYKSLR